MSRFTDWLEDVMFERGGRKYRQADLSRDLGVRTTTVSDWFTKEKPPDRDNIHKLAVHFGVTSRHIYGLLEAEAPAGLDDTEELAMGQVKRLKSATLLRFLAGLARLSPELREAQLERMERELELERERAAAPAAAGKKARTAKA